MVFLVIAAAAVVTLMLTGIVGNNILKEKPKFAVFDVTTIMGYGSSSHATDTPVIKISKIGGDNLDVRYEEGTHSGLSGTKIYLYDPDGKNREVKQSVSMKGDTIMTGEIFYIFYYVTGKPSDSNVWITNNVRRITEPGWGGVQDFDPSGEWRIVIVDEDGGGVTLLDKKLNL